MILFDVQISEATLVLFLGAGIYLIAALGFEAAEQIRRWWNRRKCHE